MTDKPITLHDAILTAVSSCGHSIDAESVTLYFDPKQPGHNALNQLSRRIEAAVLADRALNATAQGMVLPDAAARERGVSKELLMFAMVTEIGIL